MRRTILLGALAALTLAALTLGAVGQAAAPAITASEAWARPTPPGAPTGVVYLTLHNRGPGDSLVSASSPAAAKADFHTMSMVGGVMHMAPVTFAIPIAQNGAIHFNPGGMHIMLTGLKGPLKAGSHVRMVFAFAKAGAVSVDVPVRDTAPAASMAGMKM
jgi:copper(I)-binding protein